MPRCNFYYVGGDRCEELTRTISHKSGLKIDTVDPNGSSPFYQAWHEHDKCEDFCFYHTQMLAGLVNPHYMSLIPPNVRMKILLAKAIVERELVEKKVELNHWKRKK